jgi:hypothetical protein
VRRLVDVGDSQVFLENLSHIAENSGAVTHSAFSEPRSRIESGPRASTR